jgi:hypothetical protein
VILFILSPLFLLGCLTENKIEEEYETNYPEVPTMGVPNPNLGKF